MLSQVQLFSTPWTVAQQTTLSMGFPRQEYWSGEYWSGEYSRILESPSPGDLPNPGIAPRSSALQADSLPAEPQGCPIILEWIAFPSPGDLPDPGIKPGSPALQADSLPAEPPGKPWMIGGLGMMAPLRGGCVEHGQGYSWAEAGPEARLL